MHRTDEIRLNIEACEETKAQDQMAGWEKHCIQLYRKNFERDGDLNANEFETLEKIRHRRNPPALGKANTPIGLGPQPGSNKVSNPAPVPSTPILGGSACGDAASGALGYSIACADPFGDLSRNMALFERGQSVVQLHGREIVLEWHKITPALKNDPRVQRMGYFEVARDLEQRQAMADAPLSREAAVLAEQQAKFAQIKPSSKNLHAAAARLEEYVAKGQISAQMAQAAYKKYLTS